MSKEAMKLALEALENSIDLVSHEARNAEELYGKYPTRLARIQGLVAFEVAHEKAIAALRQALANEALDKKAENARELGLDYEPAQYSDIVSNGGFDPRTRRTWVGLTEADWKHLYDEFAMGQELDEFAEAIEAKLKEKNT